MPAATLPIPAAADNSATFVEEWAKAQQLRGPGLKNGGPSFFRNLEEELDASRKNGACAMLHLPRENAADFASCDIVSLGESGALRHAFLEELARNPDFQLGSHGSRLSNGNSSYLEAVERELAEFHGSECSFIINSGAVANDAVCMAVPRAGDAIVYDELIHASVHDGLKHSVAPIQKSFRHNNVEDFIEVMSSIRDSQPLIRSGARSVLVIVESFYSMDGDVCPLKELIEAAKELFPGGNAQFFVDEAHSGGVIGPHGSGLVNQLGLQKEVAIRNITFGKALSSFGAVILSNKTVRQTLVNRARPIMFSIAPPFLMCASARAAYGLMKAGQTQQAQDRVQHVVKLFMETMTSNAVWDAANDAGLIRIPLYEEDDWEALPFVTQICPVWTRPKHNFYLALHLQAAGHTVYPVSFPVVPKGADRVRVIFHAHNTDEQVRGLAAAICGWAVEMLQVQRRGGGGQQDGLPAAARHAYNLMAKEGLATAQ